MLGMCPTLAVTTSAINGVGMGLTTTVVLILCNTVSAYIPGIDVLRPVLEFLGTPFVALVIAVLFAMYFLGKKQGYDGEQLKKILDRSLRPTGQILLVITGEESSAGYCRTVEWEKSSDLHLRRADFRLYW